MSVTWKSPNLNFIIEKNHLGITIIDFNKFLLHSSNEELHILFLPTRIQIHVTYSNLCNMRRVYLLWEAIEKSSFAN